MDALAFTVILVSVRLTTGSCNSDMLRLMSKCGLWLRAPQLPLQPSMGCSVFALVPYIPSNGAGED